MPPDHPHNVFQDVLSRAQRGCTLDRLDLAILLNAREDVQHDALFAAARAVRKQYFSNHIFLYAHFSGDLSAAPRLQSHPAHNTCVPM